MMIRSKYIHIVGYLDPISKISLIPWTYFNLKHVLEVSFARITGHYGLLFSFYYIGRVLGRSFKSHTHLPPLSPILTLLALAYFMLGITSRFCVICFCYVLVGFCGGIMRSISSEEAETKQYMNGRTKKKNSSHYRSAIISLIFMPLFVGFTYSTAVTARNPPFLMCSLLGTMCFLFALRFLVQESTCLTSCCSCISEFAKRETGSEIEGSADSNDSRAAGNLSSLSGVTEDSVTPPHNFLQVCGQDEAAAKKMYFKTLQWRALERMDDIVDIPQDPAKFANIIKYYPHGFQGRSREGAVVLYEQLGKADATGLSTSKITPQDLLRHFMLRNEFIYTRCLKNNRDGEVGESSDMESVDDEPATQLMSILDVKGVGFYSISTDVMTFIKISADAMDSHYPNVVVRLAVLNSPSWFYTVWSGIARVLPESVKEKVMFINDMADLDQYVDPSMRPPEYGGTGCDLREGKDNKTFLDLPAQWAKSEAATSSLSDSAVSKCLPAEGSSVEALTEKSSMRDWLSGMVKIGGNDIEKEGRRRGTGNQEAFMGESNSYKYDVETGSWVLTLPDQVEKEQTRRSSTEIERNERDGSNSQASDGHEMALEEHGLLLAIQAAHEPSTKLSHQKLSRSNKVSSPRLSTFKKGNSFGDVAYESNDDDSSFSSEIPPSELCLLVVSIHFLNCFISGIFVTLVPIWMVSVTEKGGLDYGVRDCAMALSATGVILLLAQTYVGPKTSVALKISPVRSLRIGAGCVTIFSFLLTKFSTLNGISPWSAMPMHSPSALASANSGTWILWAINSLCGHTYTVEANDVGSGGEGLFLYYRPSPGTNILSALIPAILLGGIVCSVHLSKRASSTLLRISLAAAISSPSTVEHCVSALASILAPFVSCSVFLWAHRFNKEAPMDDSFFLSLMGTASFFIYLASMFLSLRFRGEFGIMPDDSVSLSTDKPAHSPPTCSSRHDSYGNLIMSNMDCLSIPVQDIRYLLAFYLGFRQKKKDSPLASRLFNLKVDLKDA